MSHDFICEFTSNTPSISLPILAILPYTLHRLACVLNLLANRHCVSEILLGIGSIERLFSLQALSAGGKDAEL